MVQATQHSAARHETKHKCRLGSLVGQGAEVGEDAAPGVPGDVAGLQLAEAVGEEALCVQGVGTEGIRKRGNRRCNWEAGKEGGGSRAGRATAAQLACRKIRPKIVNKDSRATPSMTSLRPLATMRCARCQAWPVGGLERGQGRGGVMVQSRGRREHAGGRRVQGKARHHPTPAPTCTHTRTHAPLTGIVQRDRLLGGPRRDRLQLLLRGGSAWDAGGGEAAVEGQSRK